MEINMKVKRGQILKELRKGNGLSQGDLAKFMGVSVQAYQKYEYGTAEPTFDSICKLAGFYKKSTDYLLGKEESAEPYCQKQLEEDLKAACLSLPRKERLHIVKAILDDLINDEG